MLLKMMQVFVSYRKESLCGWELEGGAWRQSPHALPATVHFLYSGTRVGLVEGFEHPAPIYGS